MTKPRWTMFLAAFVLAIILPTIARAIDAADNYITAITTSTTTVGTGGTTADSYYFDNLDQAITGFSTAATSYVVGATADNVAVRRNAVNANQSSVWYATDGTTTTDGSNVTRPNFSGVYANNYGQLLLSNNLNGGSDNTFANGTSASTGNIERLDFTWNAPLVSGASLAFAVFDRGAVTVHDSFAIAAITGVDGTGKPTSFSPLLKVAAGWSSAGNPIADKNYTLLRYANGDSLATSSPNPSTEAGTQGVGGIVIKASDLGVANGALVYGYALMAADVTATTSAQLADWTNAMYYPTTTDGTTGGGGIDLAAVNGIAFYAVPEPGVLALTAVFGGSLLGCVKRRRVGSCATSSGSCATSSFR